VSPHDPSPAFIVCKVQNKNEGEEKVISFEKTANSFIVQIAKEELAVRDYRCGETRGEFEMKKTTKKLNRLLYYELPTISKLITESDILPAHHILKVSSSSNYSETSE
jgi:hypothetical protein